jgi:hypothetical protein
MAGFRARALAVLFTGGIAFMGTGLTAAGAATTSRNASWAGNYDMYVTWTGHPTALFPFTLNKDHTGSDQFGDVVKWKKSQHNITITFTGNGATATYLGTHTKNGFNTKKKPGTSSSTSGASGTWYALL